MQEAIVTPPLVRPPRKNPILRTRVPTPPPGNRSRVALGLTAGLMLAVGMYFGLLRVPAKHLFAVTGWLILLLAAGMAAQGAAYLVQADILPALGETIWDTSYLLPDDSVIGKLMHTLVGYTARPYGIQLGFYAVTLTVVLVLTKMTQGSTRHPVA